MGADASGTREETAQCPAVQSLSPVQALNELIEMIEVTR